MRSIRKPHKQLTALAAKNAIVPGKYFDGNGLYLLVKASGAKQWIQRITIRSKRCEIGLGSYPLTTLAEARDRAYENKRKALRGDDPLTARRRQKAILTFEAAAREVHKVNLPTWRNEKHGKQFISTLETYVFPKIGKIKVSDVSSADILAVLSPIWLKKAETARRIKQRIGLVLKWAIAKGWRQDNPIDAIAQALPKQEKTKAHHKALPYSNIRNFLSVLDQSAASRSVKLALELTILTACRSGEVRLAVWEEVDLTLKVWTIPASRMKAKQEHKIPLTPRMVSILQQAKELFGDTGLIFPGAKEGKPFSDMTMSKLVKELGFDVHVHGFRTTFRTWAQERTNIAREVVEKALAHTIKDKAEAAYARSDLLEKRRDLMERWEAYICQRGAKIIALS
ncbi:Phage integrase family [Pseudovibrio sp. FO-BEG1]|uniref:tyrosine-type recombinase/integrase n=1 Tax=Pseudovibrio sp. (strain FO-BEG1) TaxID=911045 RepID=UPI000238D64B|nr:site-specific integrase [Pseudovibrio sp. FO-BEG1]AEV35260.1 Phage integrase family [Pseudovibrio sp. FO-BEG1]